MKDKGYNRRRVEKIQDEMQKQELNALLIFQPHNSFYISGFNPIIQSTPVIAIVPAKGEPALLLACLRFAHAKAHTWIQDIYLYGRPWEGLDPIAPGYLEALEKIIGERGWSKGRIGVEKNYLTIGDHDKIRQMIPDAELVDCSPILYKSRLIKDDQEIEFLRISAAIADRGMEAALEVVREGATEQEITVRAQQAMNDMWIQQFPDIEVAGFGAREGSLKNGLWAYCLSGPRWNRFCDCPSNRKIRSGDLVFVYTGGVCNGYSTENERTVAVGKLADEQKKVYDTVLKARAMAEKKLSPGILCSEVYSAAAEVFTQEGYGETLPGRVGHGMGLGAHEEPSLAPNVKLPLQPGMVTSFEPSMRIGELGGTQHSDTILITSKGFEYLTTTDRGFLTA